MTFRNTIQCGDALSILKAMPNQSVNCYITSPPYWGLRDYGTAQWEGGDPKCKHIISNQVSDQKNPSAITNGVRPGADASKCKKCGAVRIIDLQIGLEKTVTEYVATIVALFHEAMRVLRDDGVMFLNLGDSYASFRDGKVNGNTISNGNERSAPQAGAAIRSASSFAETGIKHKDLIGVPWRVALALQADGWILRSAAPWIKASSMPESVTDRSSTAHEYVFQFVKQSRYWFDADAVRVPSKTESYQRAMRAVSPHHKNLHIPGQTQHSLHKARAHGEGYDLPNTRNRRTSDTFLDAIDAQIEELLYLRDVINHKGAMVDGDTISALYLGPEPNSAAHFATFPQKLIEPLVLAGCPHKVCAVCGAPYMRVTEKEFVPQPDVSEERVAFRGKGLDKSNSWRGFPRGTTKSSTIDFIPSCTCDKGTQPGIVYDPFMGSGTTALVARKLGRDYAGSELNREYIAISDRALRLPFESVPAPQSSAPLTDLPLFAKAVTP